MVYGIDNSAIQKNIAAAVSLAGERRLPQDLEAKKKENQDSTKWNGCC